MRIAEIEANLRAIEGRRMASCIDVPIFAYQLPIDDEDRQLAAQFTWPDIVRRPTAEACQALVSFLTKHLLIVPCDVVQPGACIAFDVKGKHNQPDHVGVLGRHGLVHLVLGRNKVERIEGRQLSFMMRRARLAFVPK